MKKKPLEYVAKCSKCGVTYYSEDRYRFCPVCGKVVDGSNMGQTPYTVAEVAALTGLSRQTVTRLFEREPGVLVLARPEQMHKRSYRSIRIPRAVYERVASKVTVK